MLQILYTWVKKTHKIMTKHNEIVKNKYRKQLLSCMSNVEDKDSFVILHSLNLKLTNSTKHAPIPSNPRPQS